MISAFGVEHQIEKAWKGTKGDKRNTKYTAAAVAGSQAGKHIGPRLVGTTKAGTERGMAMTAFEHGINGSSLPRTLKHSFKAKGAKAMVAGDVIGTTAAVAGLHRARKSRNQVAKSAFGVDHPDAVSKTAGFSPKTAIRTADLKKIPKAKLDAVKASHHANNPSRQSLVRNPPKVDTWSKTLRTRRDKV